MCYTSDMEDKATMRLGTETGSGVNHIMSGHVGGPRPEVGMAATILGWTDRYAGTVVWVSASGKTCRVQEDTAIRTDARGLSEWQDYTYERNPQGRVITFRLGKRGWRTAGRGAGLHLGERQSYRDPSF